MAHVSYADTSAPHIRAVADQIASTRANSNLLNVDKVLLHNPKLAAGWRAFFSAVRTECGLTDMLREIVTLRVATLNRADYEFAQHEPIARKLGITEAQLASLRDARPSGFSSQEQLVLELCDAMTRHIQVPDELIGRLKATFDDRTLVELVVTISAYNCVSRTLEALKIENE